jgi:FtsP/CotA-like multicopper oxidase with cupredoxin domain
MPSAKTLALRLFTGVAVAVLVAVLAFVGYAWYSSRLPGTYNVMDYGSIDFGGGGAAAVHHGHHHPAGPVISVASLHGPAGKPDAAFTLTAKTAKVRLTSGYVVDALTFNGRAPGPELRVHQGDLVQVTLRNENIRRGVSIHWHGVDVPNAEDGVAGVTQNAVLPGETHVYRFRAQQVGTFWYHSHQTASDEVQRGLFGVLVIQPAHSLAVPTLDLALAAHDFDGIETLNGSDRLERRKVEPGTSVRLRLINSDSTPQTFTVAGTLFRVAAIDGADLHGPTPLRDAALRLAAGGRYDVAFTMPSSPVKLAVADTRAALALSPDGHGDIAAAKPAKEFDPLTYGTPATPVAVSLHFDRHFTLKIGRKPGFFNGRPGFQWTINGGIYPDVPVFVVKRGDLVRVTIVNKTSAVHPMHLHGHHVLVLSRNGVRSSGSPWWSDTLDVDPGDRYEVAFRADNPGLWMDHCHNLSHAAKGLTMHVAYAGVITPFDAGGHAHNDPE